ncbi:hypothetical protein [Streptomyces sp. NPDC005773]|uniref:hypothetical protein n=1 Tax=Streptomyces sp. NPDC005773 TaxID=3364727 RepID=UPI0036B2C87F
MEHADGDAGPIGAALQALRHARGRVHTVDIQARRRGSSQVHVSAAQIRSGSAELLDDVHRVLVRSADRFEPIRQVHRMSHGGQPQ